VNFGSFDAVMVTGPVTVKISAANFDVVQLLLPTPQQTAKTRQQVSANYIRSLASENLIRVDEVNVLTDENEISNVHQKFKSSGDGIMDENTLIEALKELKYYPSLDELNAAISHTSVVGYKLEYPIGESAFEKIVGHFARERRYAKRVNEGRGYILNEV
jgi:hypothetical protein